MESRAEHVLQGILGFTTRNRLQAGTFCRKTLSVFEQPRSCRTRVKDQRILSIMNVNEGESPYLMRVLPRKRRAPTA